MARNGSGVFAILNPIVVGGLRSSSVVNANFSDAGDEISDTLPLDAQAGMTGQFKGFVGTQVAPGLSFASDGNTGIRRRAPDSMAWVAGGQDRFYIDSAGKAFFLGNMAITGATALTGTPTGTNDMAAIEALTGTGLLRRTGTNLWALDSGLHPLTVIFDSSGPNSMTLGSGIARDIQVPYAATIVAVDFLADAVGSATVAIWKDTYANYPPTIADNICGTSIPQMTNAIDFSDTTLSGWTTSIAAGDCLRFTLTAATTIKRIAVTLLLKRFT